MYNIMAAGKPLLAIGEPNSELALVIGEEDVGWVVPPGRPERIVEAILDARANPERLAAMGARARVAAETKYSLDRVLRAYRALIDSLDNDS